MSALTAVPRTRLIERIDAFFRVSREGQSDAGQITRLLFRLHHSMVRARAEIAREYDLTNAGLIALFMLRACYPDEAVRPSELGEATMLTSGGMTKVLHSLEDRGLVTRQPHPSDARSSMLVLSEAGLALVEEIMPVVGGRDRALLLDPLTDAETAELTRLLDKLDAAAGDL